MIPADMGRIKKKTSLSTSHLRRSQRTIKKPDYYASSTSQKTSTKTDKPPKKSVKKKQVIAKIKKVKKIKRAASAAKAPKSNKKVKCSNSTDTKPKKHPNDKLIPREHVTVHNVNPTFETKEAIPFVSNQAYSKLVVRAVKLNNKELLQRLIKDGDHVCSLTIPQSVNVGLDGASHAVLDGNFEMFEAIVKELQKPNPKIKRIASLPSLLETMGTGQANFYMLGHATRPIQMSRGGKEGNNAFLKDTCYNGLSWLNALHLGLRKDVPLTFYQKLITKKYAGNTLSSHIYEAVRSGNRKLAGKLIEVQNVYGFNELHKKCLLNDQQGLGEFKAISVKKKAFNNKDFTPLHAAAINPNAKHLEALIKAEPDYNHTDADHWRGIHYSAACEGTAPMELLISKGCSPFDITKQGETPLHIASRVGRTQNVKLLLKKIKENDPAMASVNLKNRKGYTALHLAAQEGNFDVVKLLLKEGANVDSQTGAAKYKVTAMMLACQRGHLDTVKLLIEEGKSVIDKKDKLKRTALTHAVIDGQAHITSYLLRKGASTEIADTSGNTNVHYAAAYGWYFNMKLLIEAGATLNITNDWEITPLAVAYMKGHMGLADLLLQQPGIDINCKDDKGLTLLAMTVSSGINESTLDQLDYLIVKKGVDTNTNDSCGNNILHHLASASVKASNSDKEHEGMKQQELMLEVVQFIFENSTNIKKMLLECNDNGQTPFDIALLKQTTQKQDRSHYSSLALYFAQNGHVLSTIKEKVSNKGNALHFLVQLSHSMDCVPILKHLVSNERSKLQHLLTQTCDDGCTPFLKFLSHYYNFTSNADQQHRVEMYKKMKEVAVILINNFPFVLKQTIAKVTPSKDNNVDQFEEEGDDEELEDEEYNEEDDGNENQMENSDSGIGENGKSHIDAAQESADNEAENTFHIACGKGNGKEPQEIEPLLQMLVTEAIKHNYHSLLNERATIGGMLLTPLLLAVHNSNIRASEILASEVKVDPNVSSRQGKKDNEQVAGTVKAIVDNVSALMLSTKNKLVPIVGSLIKAGAIVNQRDSDGNTALHYAAHESSAHSVEIANTLIAAGININSVNSHSRNALHIACNSDTGNVDVSTEMVELLICSGISISDTDIRGRNPLHYVFVKIGRHKETSMVDPIAICSVILKHSDANTIQPDLLKPDNFGQTPLHCAAKRGSNICCMTMLRHCNSILINMADLDGNTALGLATFHKHKACVLSLLQANAGLSTPINTVALGEMGLKEWEEQNAWKWEPNKDLMPKASVIPIPSNVVKNEWQGVVYVILDLMKKQKEAAYNLVSAALYYGRYNLALTLLRIAQSSSNGILKYDHSDERNLFTILAMNMTANATFDQLNNVAEALLKAEIAFHSKNDSRAIIEAAKRHNFELLKIFESRYENSAERSNMSNVKFGSHTVISAFFENKFWGEQQKQFQSLFSKMVSKSSKKNNDLFDSNGRLIYDYHMASYSKKIMCDDKNGQCIPVNETGLNDRATILIRAIQMQNFGLCKYLLKQVRVDAEYADGFGKTPLMHAVCANNLNIVKLLMDFEYKVSESNGTSNCYDEQVEEEEEEEDEEGPSAKRLFITNADGPIPIQSQFSNVSQQSHHEEDNDCNDDLEEQNFEMSKQQHARSKKRPWQKTKTKKLPKKPIGWFCFNSNIDLNAVDKKGWSALHHCIYPLRYGSWENIEIIKLLTSNGSRLDGKDNDGQDVLFMAQQNGCKDAAQLISNLMKVSKTPKCSYTKHTVSKAFVGIKPIEDGLFENDSKQLLALDANTKDKTKALNEELELKPHKLTGYQDTGELRRCPTTGRLCSLLLNKVDVRYGLFGFYNFYRLQLVQRKNSNLHIVFTNWGRIGDSMDGQYQRTAFSTFEEALKEFASIFRQKTGNLWTDVNSFQPVTHKYRLIELDTSTEASNLTELDISLKSNIKSQLNSQMEQLLKNIANVTALKSNHKNIEVVGRYVHPFGRLQKSVILDAKAKLIEIAKYISDLEKMRQNVHENKNLEKCERIMQSLNDLSNEFYQLLPMGGFEYNHLSVIEHSHTVKTYMDIIENLLQFEIAGKIVTAAAWNKERVNPLDYVYGCMGCSIEVMNPSSDETQHLLHYIANSGDQSASVKVQCIYKVYNEKQETGFNRSDLGNRRLLWHGTSAVNLISILKMGLLAAPPSSMHTGYLYGKGIYTSDCLSKSLNYCHAVNSTKYVLLTEVALGKTNDVTSFFDTSIGDPLPKGFNSKKGIGSMAPDPQYNLTMPQGYKIPLGTLIKQKPPKNEWLYLNHNEYIVYDPNQIIVRYIVAFKDN